MKKYLGIFLMLGIGAPASAQFSLDHYHPTEVIKAEKIFKCEVFRVDQEGELAELRQTFQYDWSANVTENIRYYQNFSFEFTYDEKGRKTAQYLVPFGESYFERDTFIYDRKGRLKLRKGIAKNGWEKRSNEYKYRGKQVKKEKYFYDSELQFISRYKYKKGKTSSVTKKLKKEFLGAWHYEYDEKGNMLTFRLIDKDGKREVTQKMKYNDLGLRTEMAVYDKNDTLIQLYRTHFDEKGLVTSKESYTSIRNNDPEQSNFLKTIYTYHYR